MARGQGSKPATNDPARYRHAERAKTLTPAQRADPERALAEAVEEILFAKSAVTRGGGMKMMEIDLELRRDFEKTNWDSENYADGVRDGIAWARGIIIAEIGMAAYHAQQSSNQP